jgi:predicted secreted Zn-dependent protease
LKTMNVAIALFASACIFIGSASSQPHQTTKYSYYRISGNTVDSIYSAMISRGPRVGGVKAYAKTLAVSTPSVQVVQASTCQVKKFNLNFSFDINLPKLGNPGALNGRTKAQWAAFSGFLKTHEETHRRIWLEYAQALESKVSGLTASSCSELTAKILQLQKQMNADCNKKQVAFDVAQQGALMRHPFVRLVLAHSTASSNALKVVK